MVSVKIENLSIEDLTVLEQLVGAELGRTDKDADKKRLLRLLNAISSQKKLSRIDRW